MRKRVFYTALQAIGGIAAKWGFTPNLPFPWGTGASANNAVFTWDHRSVPTKWGFIPSSGFCSRVHE